jgi:xanthine dehydrogenase small subunit
MRNQLRFLRKGRVVEMTDVAPAATVLDYLRLTERACGTKEGCAEGDCGACTIAVGSLKNGRVEYQPVNSCIQLLGQVEGCEIVAVDDLAEEQGALHPVQSAMVKHHASQCGFCTPGFVMTLFCLYHSRARPKRADVTDWLAGNLCRCTGYRPIVAAALDSCTGKAVDGYAEREAETRSSLLTLRSEEDVFLGNEQSFLAMPASVESLAGLYARHQGAVLVSGATDVGLWITKQLRDLPKIICLNRAGLDKIEETPDALILGAAATYADAKSALASIDPDLRELLRRLGGKQIRATGTVGGNIANGSPIGDMPPALIALGAEIELRRGDAMRRMALEDFFIAYGRQDRAPGEFLTRIFIPRLRANQRFRCYKISKRFDQDISALMGAFRFELHENAIAGARIAFGGMAATPKRAANAEAALAGVSLAEPGGWHRAGRALAEDFTPISDHRASSVYRLQTAKALLIKALDEVARDSTHETRLVGLREGAVGRFAQA